MGRHPGAAHRQHRPDGGGRIIRWACPCCGAEVMISRANLSRLFTAALVFHGTDHLELDLKQMPEADWTRPVSDELIRQAVLVMKPVSEDD